MSKRFKKKCWVKNYPVSISSSVIRNCEFAFKHTDQISFLSAMQNRNCIFKSRELEIRGELQTVPMMHFNDLADLRKTWNQGLAKPLHKHLCENWS